MTVSKRLLRFTSLLVWLVSLGAGACFPVSTALAAPSDNGYSLTLKESAASMYYGNLSPTFQAFLTVPANEPPMPTYGITLVVDGALGITGGITGSAPAYTLTVPASPLWRFEPGPHTIVAKYLSVPLNQYIYSQPSSFTVYKGNATLTCPLGSPLPPYDTNTYPANAGLDMSFLVHNSYTGGSIDVDVQNATYEIIFVGAQTFIYDNIKPTIAPDYNYVRITSPSVPGNYTMRCIFKGTNLFSPTEADTQVTLQSTSGSPSPTPASPTPVPGSTPAGSGTHSQPGAAATPTGASTATATATPTDASTVTPTGTVTSGVLVANTTPPPSSHPSTVLLWMLAAVAVCSSVGGVGFLFWRKCKLPVSLTAQPTRAANTASTSSDAALLENPTAPGKGSASDESGMSEPEA